MPKSLDCASLVNACLHQGLEEGGVAGLRSGVGVGVLDFFSGSSSLDLGSSGG